MEVLPIDLTAVIATFMGISIVHHSGDGPDRALRPQAAR